MEEEIILNRGDSVVDLPPGFRFHPTDEEIITSYLTEKVKNRSFTACAIAEADLNKCEPWDLPCKAKMGEKEWYFFCQRDRKYPTGMRTNRATEAGYWKATGKDKEIYRGKTSLVGMKKTLVFYRGRAPKGGKTNWVMHEYRLEGKLNYYTLAKAAKDEWVVCRVFHKNPAAKKPPHEYVDMDDDLLPFSSPPPLMEHPGSSTISDGENSFSPYLSKSNFNSFYYSTKTGQLPSTHSTNGYLSSNSQPSPYYSGYIQSPVPVKERKYFKTEQFSSDQALVNPDPMNTKSLTRQEEPLIDSLPDLDYFFQQYS